MLPVVCPKCGSSNVKGFWRRSGLGRPPEIVVKTECLTCGKIRVRPNYDIEIEQYIEDFIGGAECQNY